MVYVEQLRMVGVEVWAHFRIDARRTLAFVSYVCVFPVHGIHVGRWTAKITQISFEVGQLRDGLHFFNDAFFASRGDEFALMC